MGRKGVGIPVGGNDCCLLWGSKSYSDLPLDEFLGSFPTVKRPEPAFNHSFPSSFEVKNEWNCTSASHLCFRGLDRDRDRDIFF